MFQDVPTVFPTKKWPQPGIPGILKQPSRGCPTGAQVAAQELLAHQGAPEQGLSGTFLGGGHGNNLEISSPLVNLEMMEIMV